MSLKKILVRNNFGKKFFTKFLIRKAVSVHGVNE